MRKNCKEGKNRGKRRDICLMTIWSVKKHTKNLSLEASHYLISENNVWLFEEKFCNTTEYIPYSSMRKFIEDSCLKTIKIK